MRKGESKNILVREVENGYQVFDQDNSRDISKGYVALDDLHLVDIIKEILGLEVE